MQRHHRLQPSSWLSKFVNEILNDFNKVKNTHELCRLIKQRISLYNLQNGDYGSDQIKLIINFVLTQIEQSTLEDIEEYIQNACQVIKKKPEGEEDGGSGDTFINFASKYENDPELKMIETYMTNSHNTTLLNATCHTFLLTQITQQELKEIIHYIHQNPQNIPKEIQNKIDEYGITTQLTKELTEEDIKNQMIQHIKNTMQNRIEKYQIDTCNCYSIEDEKKEIKAKITEYKIKEKMEEYNLITKKFLELLSQAKLYNEDEKQDTQSMTTKFRSMIFGNRLYYGDMDKIVESYYQTIKKPGKASQEKFEKDIQDSGLNDRAELVLFKALFHALKMPVSVGVLTAAFMIILKHTTTESYRTAEMMPYVTNNIFWICIASIGIALTLYTIATIISHHNKKNFQRANTKLMSNAQEYCNTSEIERQKENDSFTFEIAQQKENSPEARNIINKAKKISRKIKKMHKEEAEIKAKRKTKSKLSEEMLKPDQHMLGNFELYQESLGDNGYDDKQPFLQGEETSQGGIKQIKFLQNNFSTTNKQTNTNKQIPKNKLI